MKQEFSETDIAWNDSKRKGKGKAMSTIRGTTTETRWRSTIHGAGYCDGTCQPGPSCTLFPRRPDGKVVLPDPREASGPGEWTSSARPYLFFDSRWLIQLLVIKPDIYSGSARPVLPGVDYRPKPYHYPEGVAGLKG